MRKTFDFTGHVRNEPVEFVLNGVLIHCAKNISGFAMLQFVSLAGSASDEETNGGAVAEALIDLFKIVVLPESWPAFEAIASDPNSGVGVEELGEIVGWLTEVYSERPTQPSMQSSTGQPQTGPGLTDVSLPPVSTSMSSQLTDSTTY